MPQELHACRAQQGLVCRPVRLHWLSSCSSSSSALFWVTLLHPSEGLLVPFFALWIKRVNCFIKCLFADATWEIQLLQRNWSRCKQKQGLRNLHGHNWCQAPLQWLHGHAVWAFVPLGMLTEMDGHKDGVPNMSSHTSSSLTESSLLLRFPTRNQSSY